MKFTASKSYFLGISFTKPYKNKIRNFRSVRPLLKTGKKMRRSLKNGPSVNNAYVHDDTSGNCRTIHGISYKRSSEADKTDEGKGSGQIVQSQLEQKGSVDQIKHDACDEECGVEFDIRSYGPYRSSFYVIGKSYRSYKHLVLIAGGSGFGYFLSALTTISKNDAELKQIG